MLEVPIIQNRCFWFTTILNTNSSGLVFPLNQQSYSARSCQKERADNRIFDLRVIGSVSVRPAP